MSTIKPEVLDVLKQGRTENDRYYLPPAQLERKLYQAVNEVLERIGGKWNKKSKAHLFEDVDPAQLLDLIYMTEEMPPKNPTSFFPTPDDLAWELVSCIPPDAQRLLEPSAGKGALSQAMRAYCQRENIPAVIDCCEILPRFADLLRGKGFNVVASDFLAYQPVDKYSFIGMNPPFALEGDALAYIAHIEHAWSLLASGGVLRAIAPSGLAFREDKRIRSLRGLIEEYGSLKKLEAGVFKESGTGVNTVIVTMQKPRVALPISPRVASIDVKQTAQGSLWDQDIA